jgi:integrase
MLDAYGVPEANRSEVLAQVDAAGEVVATDVLAWITSHSFRKTVATMLDDAGLSPRVVADQLGHARPSMTQDVYMGRGMVNPRAVVALDAELGDLEVPVDEKGGNGVARRRQEDDPGGRSGG